jgi:hypothetical protein
MADLDVQTLMLCGNARWLTCLPVPAHDAAAFCHDDPAAAALAAGHNATGAAQALLCDVCQASGQRVGTAKSKHVYDKLFANGWNLSG